MTRKLIFGLTLIFALHTNSYASALKDEAANLLASTLQRDQVRKQALKDTLGEVWFDQNIADDSYFENQTVFLAIGNSHQNKSDPLWSEQRREQLRQMIQDFLLKSYRIAYDADSPLLSEMVREMVPVRSRLGISGKSQKNHSRTLSIVNSWKRLKLLLSFKTIVVSPDSLLGTGLLLEGIPKRSKTQFYSFDSDEMWNFQKLKKWNQDLEIGQSTADCQDEVLEFDDTLPGRNSRIVRGTCSIGDLGGIFSKWTKWLIEGLFPVDLSQSQPEQIALEPMRIKSFGLSYPERNYPAPISVQSSQAHQSYIELHESTIFPVFHLDSFIEQIEDRQLEQALSFSRKYSEHSNQANPVKAVSPASDEEDSEIVSTSSAVLFGSGQGDEMYEPLIQNTVTTLAKYGYSMTTGGCGGFMEVANKAAFDFRTLDGQRIHSIGIPIGNDSAPAFERGSGYSENHTLTVTVSNYDERIPILLQDKPIVVIAPGGSGTIRELSATFIKLNAELDRIPEIVFLDRNYYAGLVSWIRSLKLPSYLLDRIHIYHHESEVDYLCTHILNRVY